MTEPRPPRPDYRHDRGASDRKDTASNRVISVAEIKARWAYSEIISSRLGLTYRNHVSADIFKLAVRRKPFDAVPQALWPGLISALLTVRPPQFVSLVDQYGTGAFARAEWSPSTLLSCQTLPQYQMVPFFSFLAHPVARDSKGNLAGGDPRYEANRTRPGCDVGQAELAIAGMANGRPILLDGYLRAILWLRQPVASFPVWVPVPDPSR